MLVVEIELPLPPVAADARLRRVTSRSGRMIPE